MRRNFTLLLPLFVIGALLLTAFGDGDINNDYPSGAPAGYTGSPGDGHNCTSCHNGTATTQAGIITSNIPSQGYTPGTDYTITVTLSGSGNKGFEVSPQTTGGALVGTLTAGSGNKLVGSGKYCTHSSAVGGSSATWNFTWTAPAVGTGDVTFYGAFCITKPVTKLSTLVVTENTAVPLSATATATPGTICSGQNSQLNVTASGGSGTYSYSWTSIPPGFTSNLQNPVVTPAQNTEYIAQVNDGTITVTDSVQVSVTMPPMANAGNDTTYCITVTDIPLHGSATDYSSLLWSTNGDGTFGSAGSLNTTYYPGTGDKNNGSVILTLTASPMGPCTGSASANRSIHFDPCGVGIQGLTTTVPFTVYPNPSHGIFTIQSSNLKEDAVAIFITDLSGKILISETFEVTGNELNQKLDISQLKKGIYFIRIRTNTSSKTEKLILQ